MQLARAFAERARDALRTARHDVPVSAIAVVNRSYYCAFYAASAVFAMEGRTFVKHTAVRAALHRDLVREGRVGGDVGDAYDALFDARARGDYNSELRLGPEDANLAIERAERVAYALLGIIGERIDGSA